MENTYEKNSNERYDISGGWSLEIILLNIKADGISVYEAFPYFQDKPFTKIKSERTYESIVEACNHFKFKLIPEFVWKADAHITGEFMDYTMMDNPDMIRSFVNRVLYDFSDKIFFNSVINILEILEHYLIIMPDENEYGMKGKIDDYYIMVNKINKEMISRLSDLGFTPDRMVSNKHDIPKELINKHELCKNLVFCRFHWTPGFRTIYSAKLFSKISEGDFIRNLDYKPFKNKHGKIWEAMEDLFDLFKVVHEKVNEVYDESEFNDAAEHFKGLMNKEHSKLVSYWSVRKPTGYTKFIEDYGNELNKYNC